MVTPQITEETLSEEKTPQIDDPKIKEIVEKEAVDPASLSDAERENMLGWKRRKTIEMLNKEPKIRILIPFTVGEDENNPANQYQFFGINGVWIQVKKGDYVEVPESVFKLHQESMHRPTVEESKAQQNALKNIGMKLDPITGKKKSVDALL